MRIIRFPPVFAESLKEMKASARAGEPVFHTSGQLLRYPAIQNAFTRAFKMTKLPWTATHICRHSFGMLGMVATRDTPNMQAAMGH